MTPKHARQRNTLATIVAAAMAWTSIQSAGHQTGVVQPPVWGVRFADTVIATWPDPAAIDPAKNGWEYNTGIVLFGMSKMYDATKDPRYLDYIKRWVDGYVNEQGVLGWDQARTHNLDYIQPGMLVLFLYERTGDPRYRAAAKTVREAFDRIPKNADGGFWHKGIYPNEMWIDGIYMGQPFLVNYGRLFDDAAFGNDMAVFQSTLAASHCLDAKTGLLYHAWDQDRNASWADPKTGRSPIIWGRGMGWFVMAMVDILEQLPPSHAGYPRLHELLKKNVAGLAAAQDPKSGLWFQVLDRGASLPGNWIETSSSGMFIYAIRKGIRLGLVDAQVRPRRRSRMEGPAGDIRAGRCRAAGVHRGGKGDGRAERRGRVPRRAALEELDARPDGRDDRRERDGAGAPDAGGFPRLVRGNAPCRGWPSGCRELRGPAIRAPGRLRHLPGGLRVVRLADRGQPDSPRGVA